MIKLFNFDNKTTMNEVKDSNRTSIVFILLFRKVCNNQHVINNYVLYVWCL